MLRHNYSHDAELLDYEVTDYDTKYQKETGINVSRMRLPERYDISKFYKRNTRDSYVLRDGEIIKRNKGEYGQWRNKPEEELIQFAEDFDWQITYSFPDEIRDNSLPNGGVYGGSNVTYRRLYLILCEHFNDKEYFIDTYFNEVYPDTMKPVVDKELAKVKKELIEVAEKELEGAVPTKSGKLDRRYKINRVIQTKLNKYERFAQQWEDSVGEDLAQLIKADIINALSTGQISLKHINSSETWRRRLKLELDSEHIFYATSRLINSIQLFVKIGGNRKWQTSQGILV